MTQKKIYDKFQENKEVSFLPEGSFRYTGKTAHLINPPQCICYRHEAVTTKDIVVQGQHIWGHSTYSLWETPIVLLPKGSKIFICN